MGMPPPIADEAQDDYGACVQLVFLQDQPLPRRASCWESQAICGRLVLTRRTRTPGTSRHVPFSDLVAGERHDGSRLQRSEDAAQSHGVHHNSGCENGCIHTTTRGGLCRMAPPKLAREAGMALL